VLKRRFGPLRQEHFELLRSEQTPPATAPFVSSESSVPCSCPRCAWLPPTHPASKQVRRDFLKQSVQTRTATSLIAIYQALGGGWESEKPPRANLGRMANN
jgi:hypothetical protein